MPIVSPSRRVALLAALLTGTALSATPVLAQVTPAAVMPVPSDTATQTTDTTAPPTQGAPVADESADRLQDVTVVARKRAENAQTVPIPITIITPQELTPQNLNNFTDCQYKLPSFSVYLTNPKQLNLGIRGIGNNGFNTDGIDGSVGVFIDGVYQGRQAMVSTDFNDVAQVELLRDRRARCSARTPPPAQSSSRRRSRASPPSCSRKPLAAPRRCASSSSMSQGR